MPEENELTPEEKVQKALEPVLNSATSGPDFPKELVPVVTLVLTSIVSMAKSLKSIDLSLRTMTRIEANKERERHS